MNKTNFLLIIRYGVGLLAFPLAVYFAWRFATQIYPALPLTTQREIDYGPLGMLVGLGFGLLLWPSLGAFLYTLLFWRGGRS